MIGSRDHLCVHPEVSLLKGNALQQACSKSLKSLDPCKFGKNRDQAVQKLSWEPLDIEDLHKLANKDSICPYFACKDRAPGADIIFMPYNYLIDEKIRENYEISFKNSCIIFDEGHNASGTAEDVASFEIMTELLLQAEADLGKLQDERKLRGDETIQFKSTDEDTSNLMAMLRKFYHYLENYELDQNKVQDFFIDKQFLKDNCIVMPGRYIFEIFREGTSCNSFLTLSKVQSNTLTE